MKGEWKWHTIVAGGMVPGPDMLGRTAVMAVVVRTGGHVTPVGTVPVTACSVHVVAIEGVAARRLRARYGWWYRQWRHRLWPSV